MPTITACEPVTCSNGRPVDCVNKCDQPIYYIGSHWHGKRYAIGGWHHAGGHILCSVKDANDVRQIAAPCSRVPQLLETGHVHRG